MSHGDEGNDPGLQATLDKLNRTGEQMQSLAYVLKKWQDGVPYRLLSDRKPHVSKPNIHKVVWTVEFTDAPTPVRAVSIGGGYSSASVTT